MTSRIHFGNSRQVDKSFEGLLLSVFLHILLILILWNAKFPQMPVHDTTEVTLIEKPVQKAKSFVTETQTKDTVEDLKDQADFLSQFTKRVKKQLRAANNGPTVNAAPKPTPPSPQENKRVSGLQAHDPGEGVGEPGAATNQTIRNAAIGQSSIAEYIPGVQEGAFTALNTDQFTYYTFFARMNEQVRNRWISNVRSYMARVSAKELEFMSKMERHTMVEIILSPDGKFSSSVMQNSSGDHELDQTTVDAFRQAAPFQNPPHGMVEADGYIHLRYGFVIQFRPPSFGPAG